MHHLCDSPEAVAALRSEADRALDGSAVPPSLEVASGLTYAGAVANETMRLRPVAPAIGLTTCLDTTLGDVRLPANTDVYVLTRPPAVDGEHFAEPREFRPERWLGALGAPHNPSAHVPFGSGPRLCPGRALALLEMKVVLATLYRSFTVERAAPADHVRERFAFTMHPVGLDVRVVRRVSDETTSR